MSHWRDYVISWGWNGKDEPDPAQILLAAFDNMKSMKAY
jgi:hypothetical protein